MPLALTRRPAYGTYRYQGPTLSAMRVARYMGKKAGKYLREKYSKKQQPSNNNSSVVTQYHDIRVNKKKRRISKKKKRWIGFVKKVEKATHFNDQLHTLLEQSNTSEQITVFSGTATGQTVLAPLDSTGLDLRLGAYGPGGSSGMRTLVQELRTNAPVANDPLTGQAQTFITNTVESYKFYMQSSVLNLTIRNPNTDKVVIADIYECVCRTDSSSGAERFATDTWYSKQAGTLSPTAPAPPTTNNWDQITPNLSGSTPYGCPDFGKFWKILKKTKVVMQPGEMASYKMFGYRGPVDFGKHLELGFNSAGRVKDLIIVFNPNGNDHFAPSDTVASVEWTKSYTFKWPEGPLGQQSVCARYRYS